MTRVLPILTGQLAPNATHKRRWFTWVPGDDPDSGLDCDGRLTLCQSKGLRPGCKVERDTYAVEETDSLFRPGRAFLLLNMTDDSQPDVYLTRLYADGTATCTCRAGSTGIACKHRDSLLAVIAAGGLERAAPSAGAHAPANSAH